LPGTADLSYTAILYNLDDPRLWLAFFWPAVGVSQVGLLFPAILRRSIIAAAWLCVRAVIRRHGTPMDWVAAALLCGWLLYFRSVFSASAGHGDLAFILNNLNSIRYVDGVLAVSELFLAALLGRLALPFVAANLASRLLMFYMKLPVEPIVIAAVVILTLGVSLALNYLIPSRDRKGAIALAASLCLIAGCPLLVEHHRAGWTTYWNDLKPALEEVRASGLAELALEDGGYFAGHVVAAGNPVNPSVRALLPEEIEALADARRPRYLTVLVMPGSEVSSNWRVRYGARLADWGYHSRVESKFGAIYERDFR